MLVGFIFVCVCLASHSASAGPSQLRNAATTACERMEEDIPDGGGFMCGMFASTPVCVRQMEDVITVLGVSTVQKFTEELGGKTSVEELQNIANLFRNEGGLCNNSAAVNTLVSSVAKLPEGTRIETIRHVLNATNRNKWTTALVEIVNDYFNIFDSGKSFYNRLFKEKDFESRFHLYVGWWVKKGKKKNKIELLTGPDTKLEFLEIMIDFCALRNDCKNNDAKFLQIFDTLSIVEGDRWFNIHALRNLVKLTEMQTMGFEAAVLIIHLGSNVFKSLTPTSSSSDWTIGIVFKNINECNNREGCIKWTLKALNDLQAMEISSGTYETFKALTTKSGRKIDIVWHYFRMMRKHDFTSDYDEKLKTETDYSFLYETFNRYLTVFGASVTDIETTGELITNSVNILLKMTRSPCIWDAHERNAFMKLVKNYSLTNNDYFYLLDNLPDDKAYCTIPKIEEIVKLFYITLGIKSVGQYTIWHGLKEKKINLKDIFELYVDLEDYDVGLDGLKEYLSQTTLIPCSVDTLFHISKYHKKNHLNKKNMSDLFTATCRPGFITYKAIDKATDYNTPISQLLQEIANGINEATKKPR